MQKGAEHRGDEPDGRDAVFSHRVHQIPRIAVRTGGHNHQPGASGQGAEKLGQRDVETESGFLQDPVFAAQLEADQEICLAGAGDMGARATHDRSAGVELHESQVADVGTNGWTQSAGWASEFEVLSVCLCSALCSRTPVSVRYSRMRAIETELQTAVRLSLLPALVIQLGSGINRIIEVFYRQMIGATRHRRSI